MKLVIDTNVFVLADLITGGRDFAEAQRLLTSRILTVAEFARLFGIT